MGGVARKEKRRSRAISGNDRLGKVKISYHGTSKGLTHKGYCSGSVDREPELQGKGLTRPRSLDTAGTIV